MKTKTRTPRKILSILLCILMLSSTFCIANPFTASAATRITHTPNYTSWQRWKFTSKATPYDSSPVLNYSYRVRNVETDGSSTLHADAVYDYNPNATNYTVYVSDSETISYPSDKYVSPNATSNSSFSITLHSGYKETGYKQYTLFTVDIIVHPINTTNMMDAYDTAMNNYGTSNPGYYTNDSWEVYINALNYVRGIINSGVYDSWKSNSNGASNLQNFVYKAEQRLRSGMRSLQRIEVTIGNIFQSIDGAIITGPEKIGIKETFNSVVRLTEGYTQSVPGVRVTYADGTTQDFHDLTYIGNDTYNIPTYVSNTNVTSIMPIDVVKNKYTVTIPSGVTGIQIDKDGVYTVEHGTDFTFTVTKKDGYTQGTPVVKVNGAEIGGVQNGNTYTYTISNVTGDRDVTIDGLELNKYVYSFPSGEGFTVSDYEGNNHNSITHGTDYTFVVDIDKAYTQNTPTIRLESGKKLELAGFAVDNEGNISSVSYKATNVTANDKIIVEGIKKNTYNGSTR